jgi:hypothetical protein
MFTRLLQIRTIAGAIQCHLALFAAALRTNPPVDRRAEAFLLANFTDRATQFVILLFCIMAPAGWQLGPQLENDRGQKTSSALALAAVSIMFAPFWESQLQISM